MFESEEQIVEAIEKITNWIIENVGLINHDIATVHNIRDSALYRLEQLLCGRQENE